MYESQNWWDSIGLDFKKGEIYLPKQMVNQFIDLYMHRQGTVSI